jgi:hypothetical protein
MFYPEESEIPVYYWNHESRQVEETSINIVPPSDEEERGEAMKQTKDAIPFPVFLVSIEQTSADAEIEREFRRIINERVQAYRKSVEGQLPPCEDCGGGGTPPPPVPYFVIKAINLTDKKDNSNDEFELYAGESVYDGLIYRNTIHKFNGNTRNDAANRSVYYRDVNGDQGWDYVV